MDSARLSWALRALGLVGPSLIAAALSAQAPTPTSKSDAFRPVLTSTTWLAAHLGDPRLRILELVALGAAPRQQHVPGSAILDFDSIGVDLGPIQMELRPDSELRTVFERLGIGDSSWVVLYGVPPGAVARAFFTLDYIGVRHLAVLDGGETAWVREGHETVPTLAHYPPGRLTATPAPIVVDADWVRSRIGDPKVAMLDTRTDAEYEGKMRHRGLVVRGHVPGSRLVHWQDLVQDSVGTTDLALRDSALLAHYFRQRTRGVDTVVTYCHIGYRASISYLVARYLGYKARLYDGSYQDWDAHGYPVKASRDP